MDCSTTTEVFNSLAFTFFETAWRGERREEGGGSQAREGRGGWEGERGSEVVKKEEGSEESRREIEREREREREREICFVGCLTSQQHANVSQGRI